MTDREEKIRQHAYGIWEKEGYPHGRDEDHWHRAVREVTEEPAAAAPAQAELLPDIGDAPSLQPADAAPAKKPAARRRKAAAETTPATPRKRSTKKI